ncbi:hypothetical protein DFH06DRAFT_1416833 [Mycena polygramma]|nr:hypothetical protein DFH06DRAFT_1416833 [Mycena polygramma]
MASPGLHICPHACGCNVSPSAVTLVSRKPKWLARCPIYEAADTGIKDHLVPDMHPGCNPDCPVYNTTTFCGRDLTPLELEAWIPYIGHLPQFRMLVPTQYEHLILLGGKDVSTIPSHPLPAPPKASTPVPARYDAFFASLKPPPPKRGGTRITLGSLTQGISVTPNRTYDEFFSSFSVTKTHSPPGEAGSSTATPAPKKVSQKDGTPSPSQLSNNSIPAESQSNANYHVLNFGKPAAESSTATSAPNNVTQNHRTPSTSNNSMLPRPAESQSNANYHVLNFRKQNAETYDTVVLFPSRTESANASVSAPLSGELNAQRRHIPTQAPPPPAPLPPPPTRDLAAFQSILASTSPEALTAAVLAAYTALPAAQPLLWAHLSNTASVPDGSVRLVPRHQVCRHCAEEFDTTSGEENCTWHYGAAVLDPTPRAWPGADSQDLYFWNCCGARLSARDPGCLVTAHAPVVPPEGPALRLMVGTEVQAPPTKKRKRARGPTLRCGHCAAVYRENDGARCWWHDGTLVLPLRGHGAEGQPAAGGRWSCCGEEDHAAGCIVSEHLPPRIAQPKPH